MENIITSRFFGSAAILCVLAMAGCATNSSMVTLAPVGPKTPEAIASGPVEGFLEVYSATTQYCNSDGGFMYYPHTRYSILNPEGSRLKWVENHTSQTDESPQKVSLPAGNYYVLAQSELEGIVKVPVLIKGGLTTVVNLERGKASDVAREGLSPRKRAAKLPRAQVADWHAEF